VRVLVSTPTFPPVIGGPATYVPRLLQGLAERGHSGAVVTYAEGGEEPAAWSFPVRCVALSNPTPVRQAAFVRALLTAVRNERSDIVYAQEPLVSGFPAAVAAALSRRPLAVKVVGDPSWEYARNAGITDLDLLEFQAAPMPTYVRFIRSSQSRVLRAARVVITPSAHLKELIMCWGIQAERIHVVPNAVESLCINEERASLRARLGLEGVVVTFVGRLVSWKNVDALIEAASGINAELTLLVVGDGPERGRLAALARERGVRAVFTGDVPQSRVGDHLAASDVLALISSYEGHSHILLESMAAGLPVLTSNRFSNPDVIEDGVQGLVVDPDDRAAVRRALERLVSDSALRSSFAEAQRARAPEFSWDALLDRTIPHLEAAL
jgi:glycogen(starch) synthase